MKYLGIAAVYLSAVIVVFVITIIFFLLNSFPFFLS